MAVSSRWFVSALPLLLPLVALYFGRPRPLPAADFRFVLPKENTTLDPAFATSVSDGWLVQSVFDGLMRFDPKTLEAIPLAAKDVAVSSDGRTYTFRLDPAGRWSDGRPVVAADFEYGWKRLLDPRTASPNAALLFVVAGAKESLENTTGVDSAGPTLGITAIDESTLRVELERPCPYFLQLCAHFALMPARADLVAVQGEAAYLPGRLVGNGPYRPTLRRVRDRVRLEKNPHHPRAATIEFAVVDALAVESKATALNLFLAGDVDWVNALPALAVPRLREREELRLSTTLATNFLRMNVTRGPLADPRVRRAIDFAIDRAELCRFVYRMGEREATSLVCPGLPGYPIDDAESRDRPALARELLAAAGFPGGAGFPELELLHAADEAARPVAEAIAASVERNLSIRLRPAPQEFKVFLDSQRNLRYDVCLGNWIGDYPDPSTFLDLFASDSPNSRTGWKDAEYDRRIVAAAAEIDPVARMSGLRDAERHLLEHGPIAPIAWRGQANLVATEIRGFLDNPLDLHPLDLLHRARE